MLPSQQKMEKTITIGNTNIVIRNKREFIEYFGFAPILFDNTKRPKYNSLQDYDLTSTFIMLRFPFTSCEEEKHFVIPTEEEHNILQTLN